MSTNWCKAGGVFFLVAFDRMGTKTVFIGRWIQGEMLFDQNAILLGVIHVYGTRIGFD